jgi:hypothetical protein
MVTQHYRNGKIVVIDTQLVHLRAGYIAITLAFSLLHRQDLRRS